eukprot:2749773-Lingulodinium_polyedra.AAC.1
MPRPPRAARYIVTLATRFLETKRGIVSGRPENRLSRRIAILCAYTADAVFARALVGGARHPAARAGPRQGASGRS